MKKIIKIKLLSDMCCGNGEGNGSNIDISSTFDDVGIPIIPAKRLKGLLREGGQLLVDYKNISIDELSKIFGGKEGQKGILRISNGVIDNYQIIKSEISNLNIPLSTIITKQAIENSFASLRTQTAIDENGVAKDLSLRTTEAIKKGTEFFAEISLNNPTSKDLDIMENCVKLLRHIGYNRVRGFGEVFCEITDLEKRNQKKIEYTKEDKTVTVDYTIKLRDDIVISAGSNAACDYISGSMLLGAFAGNTNQYEWFTEVILKNTIFSNAYIADDDFVYYPTPLSIYGIKNENKNSFNYADGFEKDEETQYVQTGGYSNTISNSIEKKQIDSGFEYHYKTGVMGAKKYLFTYNKICKGQVFKGTITADSGIIKLLKDILENNYNTLFFGGSASAQYSKCEFVIGKEITYNRIQTKDKLIVEFLSDIVVLDEYGNNSGNIKALQNEIGRIVDFKACKVYSKTKTIGGYNAKWSLPKRQYTAFCKGTVLELTGCEMKTIKEAGYIGLFNNEGYGQYRFRYEGNQKFKIISSYNKAGKLEANQLSKGTVTIIKNVLLDYIIEVAKTVALKNANLAKLSVMSASCAMRLLSAYQACANNDNTEKELVTFITKKFAANDELLRFSKEAIHSYNTISALVINIAFANDVIKENDNKIFKEYIKAYIKQIKRNYQKGGK